MIVLPEAFVRVTVDREGPAGSAWLSALPATIREMAERWDCAPDGDLLYGGVGIVVPVLRKTTEPAVLKVSFPHPENRFEPDALSAWGGRGAVLLQERDDDRYAMLLERTHPTTLAQAAQGDEVAAIAGNVSRRLAVPAPAGLPRLQDRAAGWEEQLRRDARDFPDALPSRTVQAATATVRELAHHQPDTLIHGDLNARNILAGTREPWLAVDPKGWVGDQAYDCGTLTKSRSVVLAEQGDLGRGIRRTLDAFTSAAELDQARARRWAQLSAVQAAYGGRRRGFRRGRHGAERTRLIALVDELARILTGL
ncbi:aminoglycoside phosphotransferase family protein [Streptomyces alanosinicus]|uniref:Aminoglycoside O-phosphotransferase n=1 Tax=Streptomyces alanosinicus TaxID=68171 RepID=A0A918YUE4_9ACTN|nr:aminoglycoside phosphotransferase family protein [Streptomyces alanosinicus]GHE16021.1 aminoglycoside O-phosphotransferase [Streptomyces alanosinicus]